MTEFITWRLNFYRFAWWRCWVGIPEPRPLTPEEVAALKSMLSQTTVFGDNVNREYADDFAGGATMNIKRPQTYKSLHKDRYL